MRVTNATFDSSIVAASVDDAESVPAAGPEHETTAVASSATAVVAAYFNSERCRERYVEAVMVIDGCLSPIRMC
ncbi:MAG: hypothetical protein ACOH2Q_09940 [Rhodococcus sp. (in: high G+C Gram-positive bacteria)]